MEAAGAWVRLSLRQHPAFRNSSTGLTAAAVLQAESRQAHMSFSGSRRGAIAGAGFRYPRDTHSGKRCCAACSVGLQSLEACEETCSSLGGTLGKPLKVQIMQPRHTQAARGNSSAGPLFYYQPIKGAITIPAKILLPCMPAEHSMTAV